MSKNFALDMSKGKPEIFSIDLLCRQYYHRRIIMILEGFLKINLNGFHRYIDRIGSVIDFFYRDKKNSTINFFVKDHKLIIVSPETFIDRIEIDHKNIFLTYS